MMTTQLTIFDQPPPPPKALAPDSDSWSASIAPAPERFGSGTIVQITQAGPPLEHLNGQKGEVMSVMQGLASVKVEGIATAIVLRFEALEKYSVVSQYVAAFDDVADPIIVGSTVECDLAYLCQVGTVRRIGIQCGETVAWVDYGDGKPWYPARVESLRIV